MDYFFQYINTHEVNEKYEIKIISVIISIHIKKKKIF